MSQNQTIRALIAEDEPLLAQALGDSLQRLWPQLELAGVAVNGIDAVAQTLERQPQVLFFDIKMPGQSGLDAARELAEEWPAGQAFPLLVFVTAYDNYAVQAFEQAAVDYVLKPVNDARLQTTIARLQARLQAPPMAAADTMLECLLQQLRSLTPAALQAPATVPDRLLVIRAAVGNQVRLIPIEEVIYFEATDKYTNVVTSDSQSLIRTSLKELLPQLDPQQFWQIHRSTIVRIGAVQSAQRDTAGKLSLCLQQRPEKLAVSRLFAHLFKQM
jgi:DNA-binding LytR/AlgR family response regulator